MGILAGDDLTVAQLVSIAVLLAAMAYCAWAQHIENRIPNAVTGPAALVATATAPLIWNDWPWHLAAGALSLVVLGILVGDLVGMGTVKLFAVAALVIGPATWLAALATAVALVTPVLKWRRDRNRSFDTPPYLIAGVLVVLVVALM